MAAESSAAAVMSTSFDQHEAKLDILGKTVLGHGTVISDAGLFQQSAHDIEVSERRKSIQAISDAILRETADSFAGLSELKASIPVPNLESLRKLEQSIQQESKERSDDAAAVVAALRKLQSDIDAFAAQIEPRLIKLEQDEHQRALTESEEAAALLDNSQWTHTGHWAHAMMLQPSNVEQHRDSVWSFTDHPCWTCCKENDRQARGCKRVTPLM